MSEPIMKSNAPLFCTTTTSLEAEPPTPPQVPKNCRILWSEQNQEIAHRVLKEYTYGAPTSSLSFEQQVFNIEKDTNGVFVGFSVYEAVTVLNNLDKLYDLKGEERKFFMNYLLDVDCVMDEGGVQGAGGGWDLTEEPPKMLSESDWKKLLDLYHYSILEAETNLMLATQTLHQMHQVGFPVPFAHSTALQTHGDAVTGTSITGETQVRRTLKPGGETHSDRFGNMVWRLVWSHELHREMHCRECTPPMSEWNFDEPPVQETRIRHGEESVVRFYFQPNEETDGTLYVGINRQNATAIVEFEESPYEATPDPREWAEHRVAETEALAVAMGCDPLPKYQPKLPKPETTPTWKYCNDIQKRAEKLHSELIAYSKAREEVVKGAEHAATESDPGNVTGG
ncbi:hypothetical protein BZA05DRAFT_470102 [Tricharina praecox]|uniref:uncharacterized protein n=1 Tax=Tricharina praecox TaxID=43433 RepID=UPI00221E615E|nr:uncharacterized protein BZA05DRAFT_470102 [Tricharina praecox]KAI5858862.1 hypothetical protein BZA05DRAFT_470102 [Tricharina praecox]